MKVLYWCGLFWPRIGGAEVLGMHYVEALASRGHDVLVVTDQNPRDVPANDLYRGVPIKRLPFVDVAASRDLGRISALRDRVAGIKAVFEPDVIHLNSAGLDSLFHSLTLEVVNAPTVLTIHGLALEYESVKGTLFERTVASVDWVVGVSNAMLETVRDLVPAVRSHSSVILNALSEPDDEPAEKPRSDSGVGAVFTILCAGRLVREKGVDLVIKATRRLLDDGIEVKLIVAGDGPESHTLKTLARPLSDAGACEFRGWVTPADIYPLIRGASIVVVPSRWEEPFGLIALQAGQCSKPVVAARSGGLKEVVEDDVSGKLFRKDDHIDLARKIKMLESDKNLQESMGRAGRDRATRLFSMSRYVDQYVDLYHKLPRI